MSSNKMFPVTKIQQFCTGDGPGVRTTVFFKGCPLKCRWCHNPETQSPSAQIFYTERLCIGCGECAALCKAGAHKIGEDGHIFDRAVCLGCGECADACLTGALESCSELLSEDDIYERVMKDAPFYGKLGGVTFSGGEPTVHADKLIPLMKRFRESGINTAIETSGYFDPSILPSLVEATDLFLWDVKDTDDRRHRANTGVSNARIIENLRAADALGARTVLRCIILSGVNFDRAHLDALLSLCTSLGGCTGIELIPYHSYGASKHEQLGRDADPHKEWIPSREDIARAEEYLGRFVRVYHN